MKPLPPAPVRPTSGFTLIELLTVIAIISVLAAIMIPVVGQVRATARSAQCVSNMRQVGMALTSYANDNKNLYPKHYDGTAGEGSTTWMWKLAPYFGMSDTAMGPAPLPRAAGVLICPSAEFATVRDVSYALNGYMMPDFIGWKRTQLVSNPSNIFLMVEVSANIDLYTPTMAGATPVTKRHRGSANYLFCDGHVAAIRDDVPSTDIRWNYLNQP